MPRKSLGMKSLPQIVNRRGVACAACPSSRPAVSVTTMAHRKRLHRINEPGHAHALTFSCFRRQPFLNRDRSRQWLLKAIGVARARHRYHVWAYVLMPEHAHVLVWPTEHDYDVSAFLASVKTSVSRTALAYVRKNAPEFLPRMLDQQPNGDCRYRFWQRGGGYDRNVIEPKTAWSEIDYYHANPVRRGLCVRPTEWPWSSAATYAVLTNGPRRLDRESLPRTPEG